MGTGWVVETSIHSVSEFCIQERAPKKGASIDDISTPSSLGQ